MGRGRKREEIGKVVAGVDGKYYRVTQLLVCRWVPGQENTKAACLVHHLGWVEFTGRAVSKLPPRKFTHLRSKISAPWEAPHEVRKDV
jgi:hypothetical protein